MAIGFHLVEHVLDLALGTDQERSPLDAQCRLAIHILFFDHVVGVANLFVHIGKQRKGKIVFLLEFVLLFGRIGRYAEDYRIDPLEIREAFAELASLDGSARGVGFGEKVEDNVLSAIVFKRYLLAVLVGKGKIRSLVAGFRHHLDCLLLCALRAKFCGVKCYTEKQLC
jgi:hypothetical protein